MDPITYKGKFDHLFDDDRDKVVGALPEKERVPKWGVSSLEENKPVRRLTNAEAALADKVGSLSTS